MIGIVVSDRMADLLALSKSDHADGEILSEAKRRFIGQGLPCLPFHCPDMTEIRLKGTSNLNSSSRVFIMLKSRLKITS